MSVCPTICLKVARWEEQKVCLRLYCGIFSGIGILNMHLLSSSVAQKQANTFLRVALLGLLPDTILSLACYCNYRTHFLL